MTSHRARTGDVISLAEATRAWFAISLHTFGGLAGQIAVMRHKLVDEKRWIGQKRFLNALNYQQVRVGDDRSVLSTRSERTGLGGLGADDRGDLNKVGADPLGQRTEDIAGRNHPDDGLRVRRVAVAVAVADPAKDSNSPPQLAQPRPDQPIRTGHCLSCHVLPAMLRPGEGDSVGLGLGIRRGSCEWRRLRRRRSGELPR